MCCFNTEVVDYKSCNDTNKHHAVIVVDVDRFKAVNDRFGHSVGAEVLIAIAQRLQRTLPSDDLLCRYGGEEFAVFLEGQDSHTASRVAERMRNSIERYEIEARGHILPISISAGVASGPSREFTLGGVLDQADFALLQAKARGRNQVMSAA